MTVAAVEPVAAEAAAGAGAAPAATGAAAAGRSTALRTPRPGRSAMATEYPKEPKALAVPESKEPKAPKAPGEPAVPDFGAGVSGGSTDVGTFVLLFLGWVWVALPLLTGGPAKVKELWQAKWLNQNPAGVELP